MNNNNATTFSDKELGEKISILCLGKCNIGVLPSLELESHIVNITVNSEPYS
jgi:hypothetical protein